ncbi:MAG TPA: energy transducer TonB [Bacteroidia bacterium]|jgi:hypothetical protein|nr:energy transducer TonB [Bacteroidia bacterium]
MKKFIALLIFATPAFTYSYAQENTLSDTSKVYTSAEQMPQFPGGPDSLIKYTFNYVPYIDSLREGIVYINFVVTKTGEVINSKIIMGMPKARRNDSIALASIKQMPKWTPGMQNGKPVNVMLNIPVRFKRFKKTAIRNNTANAAQYTVDHGDTLYTLIEQMPKLSTGSLFDYVNENLKYPVTEGSKGIGGIITVSFIIEKDGKVSAVRALNTIEDGPGLAQEATRVIFTMPKWEAGIQNGHPVRVLMKFPVVFSIRENKYLKYRDSDSSYVDYQHSYTDSIYDPPQQMPTFKGDMWDFIYKHINIPNEERMENVRGFVQVGFIIEKDGSINHIKIIQGIRGGKGPLVERATLDVLSLMPKWNPGMQNGNPVRSRYFIFMRFVLRSGRIMPLKQDRL